MSAPVLSTGDLYDFKLLENGGMEPVFTGEDTQEEVEGEKVFRFFRFRVALGGEQATATSVAGGGVAGTRISPDLRAFFDTDCPKKIVKILGGISSGERIPIIEAGAGHGMLGSYFNMLCHSAGIPTYVTLTDVPEHLDLVTKTAQASVENAICNTLMVDALEFGDLKMMQEAVGKAIRMSRMSEESSGSYPGFSAEIAPPPPPPAEIGGGGGGETPPPVLIGAGITFWECVYEPLGGMIKNFLDRWKNGIVILGYFRRNWSGEKRFWTKILKGLKVEVVHECLLEEREETEIFAPIHTKDQDAEWNARVYKITKK